MLYQNGSAGTVISGYGDSYLMGGNVGIGLTTMLSIEGTTPLLSIAATDGTASQAIGRFSADNGGPVLMLGKSRSATIGTYTVPNSGDTLGSIKFGGSDQ